MSLSAQENAREYLVNKGDHLLDGGNVQQARYHYLLALKQDAQIPTDEQIKSMILKLDSTLAYRSANDEFVSMLSKADSLLKHERYIEALKIFDDANRLEPSFDYTHGRIDQIIASSSEIKKKLLIYNAKQHQLTYQKLLTDIQRLETDGFEIEAYFKYKSFALAYHQDSMVVYKEQQLYLKYKNEIEELLEQLNNGEENYLTGNFNQAKSCFEKALSINPKCQVCVYRLEQIEFCLKQKINQKLGFNEGLANAKEEFKLGKYQKAYYQFSWLLKQKPDDVEVLTYVNKLEELMEAETDDRMRKFNADITLEKANDAFMTGDYEDALAGYVKLKNAYLDVIEYDQFVEIRIVECLNELEE